VGCGDGIPSFGGVTHDGEEERGLNFGNVARTTHLKDEFTGGF